MFDSPLFTGVYFNVQGHNILLKTAVRLNKSLKYYVSIDPGVGVELYNKATSLLDHKAGEDSFQSQTNFDPGMFLYIGTGGHFNVVNALWVNVAAFGYYKAIPIDPYFPITPNFGEIYPEDIWLIGFTLGIEYKFQL